MDISCTACDIPIESLPFPAHPIGSEPGTKAYSSSTAPVYSW